MKRRIFWWVGGSLIVGLLLLIWFMTQFERVPVEVHTPPQEIGRASCRERVLRLV